MILPTLVLSVFMAVVTIIVIGICHFRRGHGICRECIHEQNCVSTLKACICSLNSYHPEPDPDQSTETAFPNTETDPDITNNWFIFSKCT